MVDRIKRAWNGRTITPRGDPHWQQAANYLEAAGYADAAAELHRAARQPGGKFWTPQRLAAYTRALNAGSAPHDGSASNFWNLAIDLYNAFEFFAGQAFSLMRKRKDATQADALVPIHRAIAQLSAAILDVTEPGWRAREWTVEATRSD